MSSAALGKDSIWIILIPVMGDRIPPRWTKNCAHRDEHAQAKCSVDGIIPEVCTRMNGFATQRAPLLE